MSDTIDALNERAYFFDDGLRFECQNCGACCNGEPGIIYVLQQELRPIAAAIDLPMDTFISCCLYPYGMSYSIKEDDSGRCIFYEGGCSIYPVRPTQCRTFPFWFCYLRSEDGWAEAAKRCPGVNKGRLYTKEEIMQCLHQSMQQHIEISKTDLD